jgi:hypothetical protein
MTSMHRSWTIGAAVLGVLAATGPAAAQGAPISLGPAAPDQPLADRNAYGDHVPLLDRDEPQPSFWGEDGTGGAAPPEAAAPPPVAHGMGRHGGMHHGEAGS